MNRNVNAANYSNFGDKIRKARLKKGMTQQQLADACTDYIQKHYGKDCHPILRQQICGYEKYSHIPVQRTIEALADALDMPISHLMQTPDGDVGLIGDSKEITLDKVYFLPSKPVFYVPESKSTDEGFWCLFDQIDSTLISVGRSPIPVNENLKGRFFTKIPLPDVKRLPLDEAKQIDKVFIIPIGFGSVRRTLSGWYEYLADTKVFRNYANGFCFDEKEYNINYRGYADIPYEI